MPAYAEPRSPESTFEESQAGEVMIRSDRAAIDRIPEGRSIARSMGFYSALLSMCVFTFLPAFHLIYHSHEVVDSGIALQCSGASSAHDEGQSCGSERDKQHSKISKKHVRSKNIKVIFYRYAVNN